MNRHIKCKLLQPVATYITSSSRLDYLYSATTLYVTELHIIIFWYYGTEWGRNLVVFFLMGTCIHGEGFIDTVSISINLSAQNKDTGPKELGLTPRGAYIYKSTDSVT